MIEFKTSQGGKARIDDDKLEALRCALRGSLLMPTDDGYDISRTLWNGMIDRHPAAIVRAAGAGDVMQAINFSRDNNLLLAVRGGGHNIAGKAACDGGLMLDLSAMKSVRVDPATKRARVEPGALLSDFDRETQAFGLSTPTGINSTTGMSGLTLGGGFGWQSRKRGLTIDNLVAADVVLASGEFVQTSATQHPDLFWALRGGGGNFGVVTSFEYRLHPLGPQVLAGLVVYPLDQAKQVFEGYRKFTATASDDMTAWLVMRKAPPLPFLPVEVHGKEVVVVAFCWIGDLSRGSEVTKPLNGFGKPYGAHAGPMAFADWQTAFDPLLAPGARNYWKSHDFKAMTVDVERILCDAAAKLPTDECEVFIAHLGGATNRIGTAATAYPHRDAEFVVNVHTRWREAADDKTCIAWARALFDALTPHATGGVYVNFMPEDEAQRVAAGAYGANFDRLSALKAKYDPANLFSQNQNIAPKA
ncbi:FAD-binding oxidoreductase [Denitromonas ohlonensis]|uniref:FAD-binding oxidoreductase n=2 Tax=Denitromonas TaxID=139331 RepID=A0A558EEF7_9RHOO|nr:FAD-binding oxidoreductase [Denitromonas ohlonensis]TVO64907.1 FAD-binding oxidoreductase [Denitromonas ohlonensis]TVO75580.1 FAD-binding oxidoreductase [Denitromonas ohlonensis]TVT47338.1 MAG: FAD-binding oxidoreductase [Denitromonas halophila]TVT71690.1 MAG: FAD-binding oxidoreductase [Denitromonas halophila]